MRLNHAEIWQIMQVLNFLLESLEGKAWLLRPVNREDRGGNRVIDVSILVLIK
jgi:hypothetical protein